MVEMVVTMGVMEHMVVIMITDEGNNGRGEVVIEVVVVIRSIGA